MFRWGCLVLGFASIVLGVVGYLMHPPVATEARPVDVQQAVALLAGHDRVEVELDAGLDVELPVYSALTERPAFTLESTSIVHQVEMTEVDRTALGAFLGTRVRVSATLDRDAISLAVVRPTTIGEDELKGERILAPVAGSDGAIWVVSPFFGASESAREHWTSGTEFEGVVSLLRDIGENLASYRIEYDYEEIQRFAADELGITVDDGAVLIDTGNETESSGLYRLPVSGSNGALWVSPFYAGDELPEWATSGPIRGLMWVWNAGDEFDRDLARVSGLAIPPRYGVIHHDETAVEHNRKTTFGLKLFTGLGAAMLVVAGLAFALARRRRRT